MEINFLVINALVLVFVVLLMIGHPGKKRTKTLNEERRNSPRYKTALRIKYKTTSKEGISWIRDINNGGVRIFLTNGLKTLKIGDPLEIEINSPSKEEPISVQGTIVWSKEDNAGFSINKTIQGDINRITQYLNNKTITD